MFRRGVGRRVWRAHVHERLDRSNIDDPALGRTQGIEERMRHVKHAVEIDCHDVLPILEDGIRIGGESVAAGECGTFWPALKPPTLSCNTLRPPPAAPPVLY